MFAPNILIENLCQRQKVQAAMVLDALFASDLIKFDSLEIPTILAYLHHSGIFMGESIIRRGMFELAHLGIFSMRQILSRAKGRPLWTYSWEGYVKSARKLGVKFHEDEHADPIPFAAFQTAKLYRGAKHYSFLVRMGKSYLSRKKLGARLGVGGRSTFNYELGKKLIVTPRFEREALSKFHIAYAPEQKPKGNQFLEVHIERDMSDAEMLEFYQGYDESILLVGRRKTTDKKRMPYTRFILERELERGNAVFLCKQVTNSYEIA